MGERHVVPLSKIDANPYRDLDADPVQEEDVERLLISFDRSGLWGDGQIICRRRDGRYEQCFGHARLEAMRSRHGPDYEIEVLVEDLSDEDMVVRMAAENHARRQPENDARADLEVIRAVVRAHGDGKITLPPPDERTPDSQIRDAPSTLQGTPCAGESPTHPYTASTVAARIGWDHTRTRDALRALELIEQGIRKREDFDGLSRRNARDMVTGVREALERRDAPSDTEPDPAPEPEPTDNESASPPSAVNEYLAAVDELVESDGQLEEALPNLKVQHLGQVERAQTLALDLLEERLAEVRRRQGEGE